VEDGEPPRPVGRPAGDGRRRSGRRDPSAVRQRRVELPIDDDRLPSLTDALLEAAISGAEREVADAEIQRIRLIDHRIQMCEGEDTCLDPDVGRCALEDDVEHVVGLAEGAQAMLLAMPVYAGNVPAVLKIFQERLQSFINATERRSATCWSGRSSTRARC
jgi:hypothetical protein